MATPQGTIRVRQDEQTITFQVAGRANMALSPGVRRCADQGLARGVAVLRVDLRHCSYMDSTFLGTLLCLQRGLAGRGRGEVVLVSPSPEISRLFQQMGVDDLFPVRVEEESREGDWKELGTGPEDLPTCKGLVVQAHQELATLPGPAGETFRQVVRTLAKAEEAEKKR
jgi:anti-sigma B factor antagonist